MDCKQCGKEVPQSPRKGGRMKEYCDETCRQKWRYKNDPCVRDRDTYTPQKQRAYTKKYKAIQDKGGCCELCGENHPAALCFHHIDPTLKEMRLDGRTFANLSYDKVLRELDKCQLLCHNCHQVLHNGPEWDDFLNGGLAIR